MVRGFAREDLFTVVLEHFLTDTADHADYVLPATTQLEHLDVHTSYGHTYALLNEPAIAPLGEAQPNTEIFRELARAHGLHRALLRRQRRDAGARRPSAPSSRLRRAARATAGSSCRCPRRRSPTAASRRRAASAIVDAPGLGVPDHVPNYECARQRAGAGARYPLAMISPPARNFLNSSFVNVKSLRDIEGEPLLEIHADDAAARGIADGAMVRVFNDRGELPLQGRASATRARPGVVNGLGVWWRKLGAGGTNVNELTHQRLTDIGRAPAFYDCLVEVRARWLT